LHVDSYLSLYPHMVFTLHICVQISSSSKDASGLGPQTKSHSVWLRDWGLGLQIYKFWREKSQCILTQQEISFFRAVVHEACCLTPSSQSPEPSLSVTQWQHLLELFSIWLFIDNEMKIIDHSIVWELSRHLSFYKYSCIYIHAWKCYAENSSKYNIVNMSETLNHLWLSKLLLNSWCHDPGITQLWALCFVPFMGVSTING
jgi:hypothetical protein